MKQINKLIKLDDTLDVYVVGYKTMGESIILNFANKFYGLIDCYETKSINKTEEILESLGVKSLDFICWTHTDLDHTKGLSKIINKFVDYHKTKFFIPEGFSPKEIFSQFKENYDNEYSEIFELADEKFHPYNIISSNQNTVQSYSFRYSSSPTDLVCQIKCYTPISPIVRNLSFQAIEQYFKTGTGKSKPNYFSIVLKLTIKHQDIIPINLCFTSDLDNYVIQRMLNEEALECFAHNLFLKIPHHGSTNSNKIFPFIKSIGHAATTAYAPSNLPNNDIIKRYKSYGDVSYTNKAGGELGVIKYKIKLKKQPIGLIEIDKYEGAAGIIK